MTHPFFRQLTPTPCPREVAAAQSLGDRERALERSGLCQFLVESGCTGAQDRLDDGHGDHRDDGPRSLSETANVHKTAEMTAR